MTLTTPSSRHRLRTRMPVSLPSLSDVPRRHQSSAFTRRDALSEATVHNGLAVPGWSGRGRCEAGDLGRDAPGARRDRKLLAEVGSDKSRILMAQIFLADLADFAGMKRRRGRGSYPARRGAARRSRRRSRSGPACRDRRHGGARRRSMTTLLTASIPHSARPRRGAPSDRERVREDAPRLAGRHRRLQRTLGGDRLVFQCCRARSDHHRIRRCRRCCGDDGIPTFPAAPALSRCLSRAVFIKAGQSGAWKRK